MIDFSNIFTCLYEIELIGWLWLLDENFSYYGMWLLKIVLLICASKIHVTEAKKSKFTVKKWKFQMG